MPSPTQAAPFIDTAASYQAGESEEILGRILSGRRDEFTLATKFAIGGNQDGSGVLQTGNGRRAMFRSVEASLRRLDTDYVDLLWVHFPDFVTPLDEIVRALRRSRPFGKGALRGVVQLSGVDVGACVHLGGGTRRGADRRRSVRVQPRRAQR